ncbi:MAG: PTS sugar transporter subunit IIC [Myxococcales bacterium]|nr:PTS sugar transporter subunit IIC [Myxococcales bacterium]MCB9525351.1 PTS sugar transporter subunit IIC [Myxococcales bacterium]
MLALLADLGLLALLGGLFGLDRRAAFQLMLSQPIVAVPALSLVFGHRPEAVWLGCVLQLLWMSAVLYGANTPPNETVGALTSAGIALLYGRHIGPVDDAVLALAVLLGAPTALLGRAADQRLDRAGLALAARADAAAQAGDLRALARVPLAGLLRVFGSHAALITVGTGLGLLVAWGLRAAIGQTLTTGLAALTRYVVPALGLGVTLAMVRRRRGLGLGVVFFVVLLVVLGELEPGALP